MKTIFYIYVTTNLINGKIYVGQRITTRQNDGYLGSGTIFKKALKKYGKQNFSKEIIFMCSTKKDLDWAEKYFIAKYNSTNKKIGYNITLGGYGTYGVKKTEETKNKIRNKKIGISRPWTKEWKDNISKANKGTNYREIGTFKHSEETKQLFKKSRSGAGNCRAKIFKIISPNNEIFIVHGELRKFCDNHFLSYKSMINNLNKGIILENNYSKRTESTFNTIGWEITDLVSIVEQG